MTSEPQPAPHPAPTNVREWTQLFAVLAITAAGITLTWLPLRKHYSMYWEMVQLGYIIGAATSHISMAGVWAAMGDRSWLVRVVTSAVWTMALYAAFCLNYDWLTLDSGGQEDFYGVTGAFLAGAWLLLQVPFWIATVGFRWKLRCFQDNQSQRMQFGIRQVLIVTAVVAVFLGTLRLLITPKMVPDYFLPKEFLICVFYALTFYLGTVPVMWSLFLHRWWLPALAASILFAGVLTFVEWQVGVALQGGPEVTYFFPVVHISELFWTILICGIMRVGGYRLVR